MHHIAGAADSIGEVRALRDCVGAVENQCAVVDDRAASGEAAGCASGADLNGACANRRRAVVGIRSCECQGASALFCETTCATNGA